MNEKKDPDFTGKTEYATLGGGCFWCVEAVYHRLDGVVNVMSGYAGGATDNPTYKEVCSGNTGHAEVIRIEFDPETVSYGRILELFWKAHDPTQLNRQGGDIGTQYRSVIFYHNEAQRETALASKKAVSESGAFDRPVVTEISEAGKFFEAENYHQDYYENNKSAPYCMFNITPKLKKLKLD